MEQVTPLVNVEVGCSTGRTIQDNLFRCIVQKYAAQADLSLALMCRRYPYMITTGISFPYAVLITRAQESSK